MGCACDGDIRHIERLRGSPTIQADASGIKLSELTYVHIGRRQQSFVKILAGACVVIVVGGYADLS